jgi:putative transposase
MVFKLIGSLTGSRSLAILPRLKPKPPPDPMRRQFLCAPSILPRYARRSQSLEVLIPILYLKGISTGEFKEALAALVGKDTP